MKLGLGTVQFGQAYGVSNAKGQVPKEEVAAILNRAAGAGIGLLDTSANYGAAEEVLTRLDTRPFRLVTKTLVKTPFDMVVAQARQSVKKLNADTLLVHWATDLAEPRLWPALQEMKKEGLVRRIGISAYTHEKPVELAERYRPDVIQSPFSLLDQRLLKDGSLARLKDMGVEFHARSLFLQGLLLMEAVPAHLRQAAPALENVKSRIAAAGVTPLAAALGFVLSRPEIDIGLVGVTSLAELDEILTAAAKPLPDLDWAACALSDETILTPSLWPKP